MRNDGGPAFPQMPLFDRGMSLRDYFAAQALAVIPGDSAEPDELARDAYAIADAMLEERKKVSWPKPSSKAT